MLEMKKILKIRNYKKWGYKLIHYIYDDSEYGGDGNLKMKASFTLPDLYYIGDSRMAYRLCAKRGIAPQPIRLPKITNRERIDKMPISKKAENLLLGKNVEFDSTICTIGFSEKEQKWYGWSHRATYGFGIGSKVKKGDCAYKPFDKKDMLERMKEFWIDKNDTLLEEEIDVLDPDKQQEGLGVRVKYESVNVKGIGYTSNYWTPYPKEWGKGEWTAETLDDAKQIAIDFARGVN